MREGILVEETTSSNEIVAFPYIAPDCWVLFERILS